MKDRHKIRRICESIEKRDGRLTPEAMVEHARDPASVLHPHFNWDDKLCGDAHRLEQARAIIRKMRFEYKTTTTVYTCHAYVRSPDAPSHVQAYTSVVKLRTDEDAARDALIAEFDRVLAVLKRAARLAHALGLASEIEEFIGQINRMYRRVDRRRGPPSPSGIGASPPS